MTTLRKGKKERVGDMNSRSYPRVIYTKNPKRIVEEAKILDFSTVYLKIFFPVKEEEFNI